MKRTLAVLVVVTATTVGGAPRGSASATLTMVSCGQTITRSITLANDLVNCPASGLIVAADGVTVDLNGHTIDGTSAHKPGTGAIVTRGSRRNVTIMNGTATDFVFGGVGLSGSGDVVRHMTVRNIGTGCKQGDICAGIQLFPCRRCAVLDSVVSNPVGTFQSNGINVFNSPGTRLERDQLERNAGYGISMFASPRSRIVGNQLNGNRLGGLDVTNGSDSVLVERNVAHGNHTEGIAVGGEKRARVLRNQVSNNGQVGLLLFNLSGGLASGNRATANPNGIVLYGGQASVAKFGGQAGPTNNRLVGNTATGNSRLGIWVRGDSRKFSAVGNLLTGNTASKNGAKGGILISGSVKGNRLRANTANANAGHGIQAARGSVDGGGNRASGNRKPQCVGVRCR
jgi:large repetitive protein